MSQRAQTGLVEHAESQAVSGRKYGTGGICRGLADQVVAAAAETGQCADTGSRVGISGQAGPLHTQFGCLGRRYFDDQRFDIDLGAARIELVDHVAQVAVNRFAGGDDQRIGSRVGLDESGRATAGQHCLGEGVGWRHRWRCRSRIGHRSVRRHHRAQGLRKLGRFGIFQVDHMHIPRLCSRLVKLFDQRFCEVCAGRRRCAHDDRVGARISQHADRICCGGTAGLEQPVDHHRDIGGDCVSNGYHLQFPVLGAIKRCDDPAQPYQVVSVIGDDQCVAGRVGIDGVVGRDQRTQYRHKVGRGFEIQPEHLGCDLVAAHSAAGFGLNRARLQLGFRFWYHFAVAAAADDGVAAQAQYRSQQLECLRLGERFLGYQGECALDARVDDECGSGVIADRGDHRFDVGIDEIERTLVCTGIPVRSHIPVRHINAV